MAKMKLKTKSSFKKRFKIDSKGRIKRTQACKQHNMRKRSSRCLRERRGLCFMSKADSRNVKKYMAPNG